MSATATTNRGGFKRIPLPLGLLAGAAVLGLGLIACLGIWSSNYRHQSAEQFGNDQTATTTTAVQTAGICDYLKKQAVFGSEKPSEPQNPGGSCGIDLFYDGNPGIYVEAAGSSTKEGPFYRGEDIPLDAEYIWSASAPFQGAVKLVAARYK